MLVAPSDAHVSPAPARHLTWQGLRLALVGPLPPPSAGMANQTEQLARLLRAEGTDLRVVRTNPPYRPGWISPIRGLRGGVRLLSYVLTLAKQLRGVQLVHLMANSGWSWHLHAAPAIWAASLAGIPTVVNYRGGGAEAFFQRSFRLVRPSLVRASAVVVPSRFLEGVFRRRGLDVHVVPNVIDLERFSPATSRPANRPPHLLIARNLEAIYDIPTGLRAFDLVRGSFPDARLTVAGTGPLRARLERLATDLGLDTAVRFTGRLENAEMVLLYRDADLVLNPTRVDNMPISLLEAQASGVPIVSSDVGGIPFIVEHERTGLLVGPGDAGAMAAAAMRILREPALATTLRESGLAAVTHYTWPVVKDQLLAVYAGVLAG